MRTGATKNQTNPLEKDNQQLRKKESRDALETNALNDIPVSFSSF